MIDDKGFAHLPLTFHHAEQADNLPMHHRDPFDRFLIAQSQAPPERRSGSRNRRPTGHQDTARGKGMHGRVRRPCLADRASPPGPQSVQKDGSPACSGSPAPDRPISPFPRPVSPFPRPVSPFPQGGWMKRSRANGYGFCARGVAEVSPGGPQPPPFAARNCTR